MQSRTAGLIIALILTITTLPVMAQGGGADGLPLLPDGQYVGIIYSDPAPDAYNALDDVFGTALVSGANVYEIAISWAALEPEPGQIDVSLLEMLLQIVASIDVVDMVPYVGIETINTVNLELPSDMVDPADPSRFAAGWSFDDPRLQARFAALLDEIVPLLTAYNGFFLSVGNEVDGWLAAHPEHADGFVDFVAFSKAHVQAQAPQIGVGTAIMFGGVAAGYDFVADLLAISDAAVYTYYPLNDDFSPMPPSVVKNHVALMVAAAGDKPVLFQEAGYPSGYVPDPQNNSSVEMQRDFVARMYAAMAEYPQIRMVSFLQLADWTPDFCAYLADYYGSDAAAFQEYLCSLGFHTAEGDPKPAFEAFMTGLAAITGE
jgi:hypothetical protein